MNCRSYILTITILSAALAPAARVAGQTVVPSLPEIHCKHFFYGYPLGAPPSNDLIVRDLYALSSNDTTKFADWVCCYLTCHEVDGDLDLERNWRTDPWLAPSETLTAKPVDRDAYRNQKTYDRGHLAPLAAFKGSRFASQVNYYSNIVPQRPDLNRGPWEELESKVRDLVLRHGSAWVMAGPIYEVNMPPLPNCDDSHTVPSAFWKIVAISDHGTLHVAAFIMEQTAPRTSPVLNYLTTVDEVEKRAGLDFFWQLPSPDQDTLESVKPLPWVQSWLT